MRTAAALMAAVLLPALCGGFARAGGPAHPPGANESAPKDAALFFDIPGMPLDTALQRYGAAADRSILFETPRLAGRISSPVRGMLDKDEALRQLLSGTGMQAWSLSPRMVTVEPAAPAQDGQARDGAPPAAAGPAPHYDGYLQQAVMRALCAEPALHADRTRIVLRFSVGASRIEDLRVRVAAQPTLEPAVRRALMRLRLTPPPPGVPQPVVMLVSPRGAARWGGCPQ